MSTTKLNAEELAAKEYPIDFVYPSKRDILHTVQEVQEAQQIAYQRAIEEVAQPIADERDELREALDLLPLDSFKEYGENADAADFVDNARHFIAAMDAARAILAKCPKP